MEINYIKAIKTINKDAQVQIVDNDYDQINWLDTTPIDKATLDAKIVELQNNQETAKAQKETDALAGNNKLLDLGLTQAEATALTGYTPPTEA